LEYLIKEAPARWGGGFGKIEIESNDIKNLEYRNDK
jgi:hypothetical protein